MEEENIFQSKLQLIPLDQYYAIKPTLTIPQDQIKQYIFNSYIFIVLQCRSGLSQDSLKALKRNLADMCEEFQNKGVQGFGFIINQNFYNLRNYESYSAIKDTLQKIRIDEFVSFEQTLQKLRHSITNELKNMENKKLTLIFFSSPVQYDSLNPVKQSYKKYLNRHQFDYKTQIKRIKSVIVKNYVDSQAFVIGYQGIQDALDSDILYQLTECAHRYGDYEVAYSYKQLDQIFKRTAVLSLYSLSIIQISIPLTQMNILEENCQQNIKLLKKQVKEQQQNEYKIRLINTNQSNFQICEEGGYVFIKKNLLDLIKLKEIGYKIQKGKTKTFNHEVDYHEPNIFELINCQTNFYSQELRLISHKLITKVIEYKKIRDPNNKYHIQMEVDQQLQFKLRQRIQYIGKICKDVYSRIFDGKFQFKRTEKGKLYQNYTCLKFLLDSTQMTLSQILKKQIMDVSVGKIAAAIVYYQARKSLQIKLVKRINSNPKMLDQIYNKINVYCTKNRDDLYQLETKYKQIKSNLGNCFKSDYNFVKALLQQDCLAIMFQMERPDSAIADPGRLRMRQISPFVVRVSTFFDIHYYSGVFNNQYYPVYGDFYIRQENKLDKEQYKEMWDYWGRADKQKTAIGLMPLYICEENWQVSKLLMKPCLAWTACGQPLAYTFSQTQTIPFMVLSFVIRKIQEHEYRIIQIQQQIKECKKEQQIYQKQTQRNTVIFKKNRMLILMKQLQKTSIKILEDLSTNKYDEKFSEEIIKKYINYQNPINRTVDVINNNSSFLGQLYCTIKKGYFEKPSQTIFHQFFKTLIEQQLRRQTNGWNQEEIQDQFINKLLNSQIEKMNQPEYVVINSTYKDNFENLLSGLNVNRTEFQIQRAKLQMMIKKDNKFNDTQRMLLIEYKRLYQNRVLWMWYVRFLLYGEKQRKQIHKWKSLDLGNSYMLFTMIIQNKKQRKNAKRRQAILKGDYVNPFDYYAAREYLEHEFIKIRNKKENQNIKFLNAKKYGNAANVFAQSPDIQEAAGSLINIQIGKQIPIFFRQLVKGHATIVEIKLKMLLKGNYMGVRLMKNGWKMSKKRNQKLRKVYPQIFDKFKYMF